MELIIPSFEIIEQKNGIQGIYEQIELPGRICYGSQDKICEGSAEPFVKRLMEANHGAPLEHCGVYLDCPYKVFNKYVKNPYSRTYQKEAIYYSDEPTITTLIERERFNKYYVSTNLRVLFENSWMDDLEYLCEPTKYHEKRITVKFTCDIGVSREYNRHRRNSINEESTRYCNYSKDKFGAGSIKFIKPNWIENEVTPIDDLKYRGMCYKMYVGEDDEFSDIDYWLFSLKTSEYCYNNLIRLGWKPQQARTILPLGLNVNLIHTAYISDWEHFFDLRAKGTTGAPHPQAKELAEPLMNEFIKRGYIKI